MPHSQLFLIDAHALCYRAFYAIRGLATSRGQPTNAVYGFVNTLRKILRDRNPGYLAVCFDVKGKTLRQEKFAAYKIQRPVMPDDLASQIPLIKDVVRAYNLPVLEAEGYEADDVIAAVARRLSRRNVETVIVSDDKDMYQLVGDRVKVYSVRQDRILTAGDIEKSFGVAPCYVADLIALAGDKVDNIPGVRGVGDVSARKLIARFGHLEDIYARLNEVKPSSLQTKLSEQKEQAFLSKELAVLEDRLTLPIEVESWKTGQPDTRKLFELFSKLEFKKWAAEMADGLSSQSPAGVPDTARQADPDALRREARKAGWIAVLAVPSDEQGEPANIYAACGEKAVLVLPAADAGKLKEIMEDDRIVALTHDLKGLLKILTESAVTPKGEIFDMMLAGYLALPVRSDYTVRSLVWEYLKQPLADGDFAAQLLFLPQLWPLLKKDLAGKNLTDLFTRIEIPLAGVLSRMEQGGVRIDTDVLAGLSAQCESAIAGLTKDIYRLAGGEFNMNSPKQLSGILFEKLKLPPIKKTKTGFSTNEEVLVRLADMHPLPAKILEYRQLAKLKSTYLDALPKLVDPASGRIHASFNQAGAETGRLSSNNPNLQNIPVRTELGRQIRKAFVPDTAGDWIVAADYSQIELRILAHLSGDKHLIRAFADDQDIHAFTAALIFDVPEADVTEDMRASAKRVNFGIIYGMSAFGLAKDLGVPQGQAQAFIDKYFLRYPGVKTFMDEAVSTCERQGYVMTLLNRRRYIPDINSPNMAVRQFAQRQAINTPVQGSAADLMKMVMIRLQDALDERKARSRMTITVHDEIVLNVPERELEDIIPLVRERMETALDLAVPIKVTVKKGKNWLEMQRVD